MSYVALLAAALLVVFLAFVSLKSYFKGPEPGVANRVKEAAGEQSIDTSSYGSVLSDVKSRLNVSVQKEADNMRDIEGMK